MAKRCCAPKKFEQSLTERFLRASRSSEFSGIEKFGIKLVKYGLLFLNAAFIMQINSINVYDQRTKILQSI
ncbi:MAG: hypothetical protein ACPMAG_11555, partial [Limisphaerales bacterium]